MGNVQIETVKTERLSMDYFRFGHGKETMVILPGLSLQSVMGFADMVVEAYQVLAEDYTIYLFDRRKDLPCTYSVREMAQDTAEALRALGLEGVNLFGASQGGMIAMEMAIRDPDLVQKLVLGSTTACLEEEQYQTVEKWIRLAEAGEKEELYLAFGREIYPQNVFEQSRDLLIEAAKTVADEDLERFITMAEGMRGFDVTGDLQKIRCPVLVIGSRDDRVLGDEAAARIVKNLDNQKDVVLFMYDGYGHAAYDMAPDYKERIKSFLA